MYMSVLLIGRLTGAHTSTVLMPVFTSFPVYFVIPAVITVILWYIFTAPFYYGTRWYFWQAAQGYIMPVSSVFAGYRKTSFIKCIKLKLFSDAGRIVPLVIVSAAGGTGLRLAKRLLEWNDSAAVHIVIYAACAVLLVSLFIIYYIVFLKLIPVPYIFAASPDSGIGMLLSISKSVVSKKSSYMFFLYLSILPISASCIFIFPLMFVQPYVFMITSFFVKQSIESISAESNETDNKDGAESKGKEKLLV